MDTTEVEENLENQPEEKPKEKPPTYVKLAMRNMVRKRGISLKHFFLTAFGLLAFFVGVSYLTR